MRFHGCLELLTTDCGISVDSRTRVRGTCCIERRLEIIHVERASETDWYIRVVYLFVDSSLRVFGVKVAQMEA